MDSCFSLTSSSIRLVGNKLHGATKGCGHRAPHCHAPFSEWVNSWHTIWLQRCGSSYLAWTSALGSCIYQLSTWWLKRADDHFLSNGQIWHQKGASVTSQFLLATYQCVPRHLLGRCVPHPSLLWKIEGFMLSLHVFIAAVANSALRSLFLICLLALVDGYVV